MILFSFAILLGSFKWIITFFAKRKSRTNMKHLTTVPSVYLFAPWNKIFTAFFFSLFSKSNRNRRSKLELHTATLFLWQETPSRIISCRHRMITSATPTCEFCFDLNRYSRQRICPVSLTIKQLAFKWSQKRDWEQARHQIRSNHKYVCIGMCGILAVGD